MLKRQKIEYQDGSVTLEAYCVYNDSHNEIKPAILIAHDWSGKNEFACKKADKIAELGYVGYAIDMFGKNKIGHTKEEKMKLMQPLMQDRNQLQKRILTAFEEVKKLDVVDSNQIGAIGFCFGGLCVLDLARSGVDVKGVVSFHGLLQAPESLAHRQIKSKILALHGFDDPMVSPDHVIAFAQEMTRAKVDWQIDIYGHTMHAFTNPQAHDPDFGTVYNINADTRAWLAMTGFFKEVFAT